MKADRYSAYCRFWAQTMLEHLKAFEEHSHEALEGTDPEDIHQTRVASRRLLTLLSLFPECLSRKKQKRWAREIRKEANALSSARDLDVQVTRIEDYLKGGSGKPLDKGPVLFLEKKREERRKAQANVFDAIKEIDRLGMIEEIRETCKKILEKTNGEPGFGASYAPVGIRICEMLDDLLSYECSVHKESDIEVHHKMRIAAKKLRYALETYAGLCGNESCPDASTIKHLRVVVEMSEYVSALKKLQEILGEMHDYDVLMESVDECRYEDKDDKKNQKEVKESRALFGQYLKNNRAEEYKRLVSFWNDARGKKTFERIKELVYPISPQNKKICRIEEADQLVLHERRNANQFIEKVLIAKQKYKTDAGHEKQVGRLALKLFDDLKDMHRIGNAGRMLLECA